MATTMVETSTRKACDRCHAQKLCCKRLKDDKCERCTRLGTVCRSSPSLRSKKQQPLLLQQQQLQHYPSPSDPGLNGLRSPKRRRTNSELSLVLPDTGTCPLTRVRGEEYCLECVDHRLTLWKALPMVSHPDVSAKGHMAVTPDPVLEAGEFNFNLEQLGLVNGDYLSHPRLPAGADHNNNNINNNPPSSTPPPPQPGAFTESWDPHLVSSNVYPLLAPESLLPLPPPPAPQQADGSSQALVLQEAPRGCVPEHSSPDKRPRQRTRQRPRQIHLVARSDTTPLARDAPLIHWMAQLTDINARLLDLSSALPSYEATQNGCVPGQPPAEDKFHGSGFPIDEMFKLTRRVADILEQPPPEPSEAIDGADPGNAMFILSTYTRLLDMYQKVFGLVSAELSQTISSTVFEFWKLPEVTVGSFAVESSPFLQMSLTIQLAEEFLERLRRLADGWSAAAGGSASLFSGVVDISFQAFKEREEKLARHLVGLRGDIEALLDA